MDQQELYEQLKAVHRMLANPQYTKQDALDKLTPLLNRLIYEEIEA